MAKQGYIISIFGTKGGVGKSIISLNLGIDIARETGSQVALIDLDLSLNGDLEMLLGMTSSKSLAELIPLLDSIDGSMLRSFLSTHSSGLTLIPALRDHREISLITEKVSRQFLSLCARTFDYTVIDCGSSFTPVSMATLDCSNLILLISQADFLSLHQTVKTLSYLRIHHFPKEKIEVILNNVHPKIKKDDRTINSTLRRPVLELLPSSPDTVGTSIIRREPFVLSAPRSLLSRKVGEVTLQCLKKLPKLPNIDFRISRTEVASPTAVDTRPHMDAATDSDTKKLQVSEREDLINQIKKSIHESLIDRLDLRKLDVETGSDPEKAKR
ncbi:CpaE family protein [candidate division CSSED10-310 bacterium]|uniref:CpaE family protein n=1 Tax=candidate division CSSED10-310 bacterium TaxID=2855610 RepID=A0ABV6YX79_UNCC1